MTDSRTICAQPPGRFFWMTWGGGIEKWLQQDGKVGGKLSDFSTHFQLRGLRKSGREPVYVANFLLMHCEATTAPPRELNHYWSVAAATLCNISQSSEEGRRPGAEVKFRKILWAKISTLCNQCPSPFNSMISWNDNWLICAIIFWPKIIKLWYY